MTIERTMTHEIFSTPNSGRRIYLRRTTEGINAQRQNFLFFFFFHQPCLLLGVFQFDETILNQRCVWGRYKACFHILRIPAYSNSLVEFFNPLDILF